MPADRLFNGFIDQGAQALRRVAAIAGVGQLQPGHQLGQALLQRLGVQQLVQRDLWLAAQCMLHRRAQARLVHHDLLEQPGGVDVVRAGFDGHLGQPRPHRGREQRPLQRQRDVRTHGVDLHHRTAGRRPAQRECFALDAAQQLQDAAVLHEGPVVQEAAQLLRQLRHGALRVFAGLQPVVVHAAGARLGVQRRHRRQRQHLVEPSGQRLLPPAGHQKVPERAEAAALVGVADGVALAHDLIEQRALAARPQRDLLAHPAVQLAKVVLHLAEIGQQLARQLLELQEALADRRVVQQRCVTGQHAGDLGVERVASLPQLLDPLDGVGLGAGADLLQQREQRQQTRLGADEGALGQRPQPGDGLLGGGRQVELRLVGARLVELAQPALVRRAPVVEVLRSTFRVSIRSELLAQGEQFILQRLGKIGLGHHPHVRRHEHPAQKARHQRRVR